VADPGLISLVKDLFASQRSAALATQAGGQPYLSLMAFAVTPDLTTIIVATERGTRKYANLAAEPRVALLVDNRSNTPADTEEAVAVTILGQASEASPDERQKYLPLFLDKHPQLADFATSPTCVLIAVRVSTYIVVQRFEEVQELRMI
jgi:nitroimidazol reductase NimA-like FMN-containing flavoprotein (pyridoxamine 5'-phosphate oxidase superfamily)